MRFSQILQFSRRVTDPAVVQVERMWFAPIAKLKLRRFTPPYKLHFACGTVHLPDWINIDLLPASKVVDVSWDIRAPFPLPGGSCTRIFHEHFLEHLPVADGVRFLRDCHRLLAPGGVLRVAMPDLTECVRQYWEDDWRDKPWMKQYGFEWIRTRAELLNICFREWDHRWLYDREELHRRLREAGFETVRDCAWRESELEDLTGRETRAESLLICEAVK